MSSSLPAPVAVETDRAIRWSLVVGIVAVVVCAIGSPIWPDQFFRAYLAAYLFYLGIGLGCMVILMIYHLTGGAWGYLVQRILEAGMRTLPLLAILFIPVALGVGSLYLWARPDEVAKYKDLQHKQIYLNAPFFWGRAALFFALWIGTAFLLDRWSRRHDQSGDPVYLRRLSNLAGPGLVVFGITTMFSSIDWIMSLQPAFRSTIFGPLVASGEILSGMAVVIMVLAWLGTRSPLGEVTSLEAVNDLGNLLFTFLVIWAYLIWFQFMLIWIANLPWEVIWYQDRSKGGWQWVAIMVFVFHFVVPFFLLLMREVKQHPPTLAKVAALILFMQLVYTYYLVMPSFPGTNLGQHWMDFLMPFALGGLWLAYFLWQLKRRPLLSRRVEDQVEALHLRHLDEEAAARSREIQHG